jgi:hypothetical protein
MWDVECGMSFLRKRESSANSRRFPVKPGMTLCGPEGRPPSVALPARRFALAFATKPERSSAPGREAASRPLGRSYDGIFVYFRGISGFVFFNPKWT